MREIDNRYQPGVYIKKQKDTSQNYKCLKKMSSIHNDRYTQFQMHKYIPHKFHTSLVPSNEKLRRRLNAPSFGITNTM